LQTFFNNYLPAISAMATHSQDPSAPASPLPSFEELKSQGTYAKIREDVCRLRWVLDGPLETAITVMPQPYHEPDATCEPYFQSSPAGAASNWHSISQSSFLEPPVSSCTISVRELDDWAFNWEQMHVDHAEDFDDEGAVISCCGEQAPEEKEVRLTVKATGDFLTIHDYVTQVHPWLLGMRQDLLVAVGVTEDFDNKPLPGTTRFFVYPNANVEVFVLLEKAWLNYATKEWLKLVKFKPQGCRTT